MLAQKQPSFKQCVIADLSSDFAPKMNGTEAVCRNCGLLQCAEIADFLRKKW